MKINDEITLSIAAAVSDVLEGKKVEVIVAPDVEEPKVVKSKLKSEAGEPEDGIGKKFKKAHPIKKSGEKEDGTVVKEVLGFDEDNPHDDEDKKDVKKEGNKFTLALNAARKSGDKDFVVSGKKYKVEDYDEDEDDKEEVEEGFDKNLVKKAVELALKMSGNMTGAAKKIEMLKKGLSKDKEVEAALRLANEEVSESVLDEAALMNEAEDNKAKYKAFFDKALKKFGVDSPAELKGDKKKEFFDYVDANYNSADEPGKDGVNEILGFVKKVVNKVKDTVTGKSDDTPTKNPVTDFEKQRQTNLEARLKKAKEKLRDAEASLKKAWEDDDEDRMDYWGDVEHNRMADIEELEKQLKKDGAE